MNFGNTMYEKFLYEKIIEIELINRKIYEEFFQENFD